MRDSMKCNYYCFEVNSTYYAIDIVRLIPLNLSRELYLLLYHLQQRNIKYIENFDKFTGIALEEIKILSDQNILIHKDDIEVNNSFRELSLSFIPTLSCNFKCKYCYSNRKYDNIEMKEATLQKAIDFFCKNFDFSFCRVDFVSGGEPLYNKPALIKMIDSISECLDINSKNHFFWLCSNGTLFDDEIVSYLDKKHCNIGISLDGPQNINDANRVFKNGKGTYRHVVEEIQRINNRADLSRNIKNLWNSAVITEDTYSLPRVMRNSYELGFRNLQMKVLWSSDVSSYDFTKKMICLFEELSDYMFKLIENDQMEEFLMICNENDTFGKILLRIIIQSGVVRRCNAGINKFSVSPEGEIYPCDSFMSIGKCSLGNIYDGFNDMYFKFVKIRNNNIEGCKNCWIRNICGGDCYYNSYINSGDPTIPDEKICNITKSITKLCIKLVINLYCSFPDKMQNIYNILAKRTTRME